MAHYPAFTLGKAVVENYSLHTIAPTLYQTISNAHSDNNPDMPNESGSRSPREVS